VGALKFQYTSSVLGFEMESTARHRLPVGKSRSTREGGSLGFKRHRDLLGGNPAVAYVCSGYRSGKADHRIYRRNETKEGTFTICNRADWTIRTLAAAIKGVPQIDVQVLLRFSISTQ
jgi:hypothetical protein